ncbi:hypothetical protein CFN79_13095 [Chromobacterium vaccinii]|nr:hypothetical protein CFN79_13095 [Chromobacterium vaccinii]
MAGLSHLDDMVLSYAGYRGVSMAAWGLPADGYAALMAWRFGADGPGQQGDRHGKQARQCGEHRNVAERDYREGALGGAYQPLTLFLDERKGRRGAKLTRLPPGHAGCSAHCRALEEEGALYGRRAGDAQDIRAGAASRAAAPAWEGWSHIG